MKNAEHEQEKEKIARKIEESGLVEKCENVALLGKRTYHNERDCSTHVKWEYSQGPFKISFESGHYAMGDGREIQVVYNGEEVFLAYDHSFKRNKHAGQTTIEVGSGTISNIGIYKAGDWEKEIVGLLEDVPEGERVQFEEHFQG